MPSRNRNRDSTSLQPPTPWISVVHPITENHYKFRLITYRRGGAIRFDFHRDCPTNPGGIHILRRATPGRYECVIACSALLAISMFDPSENPALLKRRSVWRTSAADYQLKATHIATVTMWLEPLLNPKRGRPVNEEVNAAKAAAEMDGGVNPSYVACRARRRAEIITAATKIIATLDPLRDKLASGNRMRGYTMDEVHAFRHIVNGLFDGADSLRRTASGTADMQVRSTAAHLAATAEPIDLDDDKYKDLD